MQILGLHIIGGKDLRRQITDAQAIERRQNNAITKRLLFSAEMYRRVAESALCRPVNLPGDIRPKLLEKMKENRLKQKTKQ